jgi:hypothetical protein
MTKNHSTSVEKRSKPLSNKGDPFAKLNELADVAVVDCFNSFNIDLKGICTNASTFRCQTSDVARARRIVNSWAPQEYESGQLPGDFDVPYVLSGFFDRYLSVNEEATSSRLEAKAARKFLGTNLSGVAIDQYVLNHAELDPLLTRMSFYINGFFNIEFNPLNLYHLTGHGPNRTTDIEFADSYLHLKNCVFAGPEACLQQLVHYLHWDFQLRDCILNHGDDAARSMINGWDISGEASHYKSPAYIVNITNTGFVPKKFDSLRTMCPEPTTVAFFAKMVALWISHRLIEFCHIDLRSQPHVHQRLAKLGSLFPELNIATIDWSEASDRIWLALVERLMQEGYCPGWFSFMLNVCRCKSTTVVFKGCLGKENDFATKTELDLFLTEHCKSYTVEYGRKGETLQLYTAECIIDTTMISTMGNPLTFPLQTLIFWAFLESCTDLYAQDNDIPRTDLLDCSSFGDDGIVDSRVFGTIQHYAEMLNWKLNTDKSFTQGGFRESCGGDFYHGRPVRPFQPKRPPFDKYLSVNENKRRFQAWLYICFNNLCIILDRTGRPSFELTAWLEKYHSLAGLGRICLVPPSYPDGSGVRTLNVLDFGKSSTVLATSPGDYAALRRWDVGPCITGQDDLLYPQYHNPYIDRSGFTFWCISSQPHDLPLDDLEADHYYHQALKDSWCTDDKVGEYIVPLPFFDMTLKKAARLDDEGNIAVKECRLRKTKSVIQFWQ